MTEQPESVDVIAVGAHPDDVEIGCGGLLAKLVQQGHRVGIVDLTNGEPTPACPHPSQRLAEATEAARVLGVQLRITLPHSNRCLFDNFGVRLSLASIFRKYRPSIVLGIGAKTPMASPDHWQAMQITDAAVFYSRLSKWDDEFADLPPHPIKKQFWYPLGFSTVEVPSGGGQFVVDISSSLELKLNAIRAYASQFPPGKQRVFRLVESQAHYFGGSAGFEAGELLVAATTLGITDFVRTVLGKPTT